MTSNHKFVPSGLRRGPRVAAAIGNVAGCTTPR